MFRDAILFPLSRFGCVFDQAGIKIADPAAGKAKWVSAEKAMGVVIDELPVERDVGLSGETQKDEAENGREAFMGF